MKKQVNFFQILTVATFLFFAGCASVGVTVMKQYPAKPEDCDLDVYTGKDEISKEYEAICLIDSKTGSTAFSEKTVAKAIELAKPEACECGSDAILVASGDKEGMSAGSWGEGKAMIKGIKYK